MNSLAAPSEAIIVHGNISAAALRRDVVEEYVVWAIARTLQGTPRANGVSVVALVTELCEKRIFRSRGHARKIVRNGTGTFWAEGGGRVWLFSPRRIAESLDASCSNGWRHVIPAERLTSRAGKRGSLWAATLREGDPISQLTIRQMTSVSERTQRRYRADGHVASHRQIADLTALVERDGNTTTMTKRNFALAHESSGVFKRGQRVFKRIPNSYTPTTVRLRRGRRTREQFAGLCPLEKNTAATETAERVRVYFKDLPSWRHCSGISFGKPNAEPTTDRWQVMNFARIRIPRLANDWEAR